MSLIMNNVLIKQYIEIGNEIGSVKSAGLPIVPELPASGTLALTGEVEVSPRISFAVFRISAQSLNISSLVVLKS